MKKQILPKQGTGILTIPASKSDSQRSLLAAALAKGSSVLYNVGSSHDELAMLTAIQELGAEVEEVNSSTLKVKGIEHFPTQLRLNMGESGLGIRLITSVCAAHTGSFTIEGKGSLAQRPLTFFEETLPKFGVKVLSNKGFIPLQINGPMHGAEIELDGSLSSQYISGLLMALPMAKQESILHIPVLNSLPYVQMTLQTLEKFGIQIQQQNFHTFTIPGNQQYNAREYTIESDWSSASCWLVASALGLNIQLEGLSLSSLQADKQILQAFLSANCRIENKEGKLSIVGENRKPFTFDATHCPDLFPALACFAALCEGQSEIIGVQRLKHKESDRGTVLQSEFAKIGIRIDLTENSMLVHGQKTIVGGTVSSHNDHRIAMCLGIAALFSQEGIEIEGAEAVAKSYPQFWDDLEAISC